MKDQDWNKKWKDNIKPIRVGKNIVISPTWIKVKEKENDISIYLDSGMAFGTGHHATTANCLCFLEQIINEEMPKQMLDVGTGSGILAIVAAKLGVDTVVAIDVEGDAIQVSKENAKIKRFCPLLILKP